MSGVITVSEFNRQARLSWRRSCHRRRHSTAHKWRRIAGCVLSSVLLATAPGSALSASAGATKFQVVDARTSSLLDVAEDDVLGGAALKAAAWARLRGRLLAAAACVNETPPRLGCRQLADVDHLSVATQSITPQEELGELALVAAQRLEGVWSGDGYTLRIDNGRAQANISPNMPFEWQRFVIRRVFRGFGGLCARQIAI